MRRKAWKVSCRVVVLVLITGLFAVSLAHAAAQGPGTGSAPPPKGGGTQPFGTVGIRISVSNLDPTLVSADFDLTMYTRGFGPNFTTGAGYVGFPFIGIPALDYGDGSTVSTATAALTNSGGGPGGSNVYRTLASFSHSYPGPGNYTATAGMWCVACVRFSSAFFPPGSPVPATFTRMGDLRPASVIGNLTATYLISGTTYTPYYSTSVVFTGTYYYAVTNTAAVNFGSFDIPTVSQRGMIFLGASLLLAGVFLLRRL